MDIYFNNISLQLIAMYIFVAVVMYFVFSVIEKYIIPLVKNSRYARNIQDIWMKFKIVSVVIFCILFYYMLLNSHLIFTLIFSIIIIGLGWNFWQNVFSGVLIKYSMLIREGEMIETEKIQGEVKAINFSNSNILNAEGETVTIPNYQLRTSIVKHLNEGTSVKTYAFEVQVNDNLSINEVKNYALNCPYITSNQKINVQRKDENKYVIIGILIDAFFEEDAEKYFSKL